MTIWPRTTIFCLLSLVCFDVKGGPLSNREYRMAGELVWTSQRGVQRWPFEILRDGTATKLTAVLEDSETNFNATVYLSTPDFAVTFYQMAKDLDGRIIGSKSWNNGQATISGIRMPETAQLVPLWLMTCAREEMRGDDEKVRTSLFDEFPITSLHERSKVKAEFSTEPFWESGYSRYSENFTNAAQLKAVRKTAFSIESWTNLNGITFPKSCVGSCSDWKAHYEVVVSQINELKEKVDARIPTRSLVTDWRPLEDGRLTTGCSYTVTNGIVRRDILVKSKSGENRYAPALDWTMSHGLLEGEEAPEFSVTDLNGKSIKLGDLRGKYVLCCFWATDCGPCIFEMPELKGIFEKYRSYDRFAMIGFALDEKENVVRKFVAKENIQWPQAVLNKEFDDPIVRQYKVHGIPRDYLIGPDGKVVALSGFDGYLKRVLGVTEINR